MNEVPNATAYRLANYAMVIAFTDADTRELIKWLQERLAELHSEVEDQ